MKLKLGFRSGTKIGSVGVGMAGGGAVDTTKPTCTITCAQSSPSSAATLNFTITFSEVVTGFEVGDFTVAGGTKSALGGSGAVYTCDVTPTAYEVTADVAANVAQDAAGNLNTAATQVAISALVKWYLAGAVPAANCKLAYQPIGAASLAASYVNLANPGTNNAAPGTAPDFAAATGWQFNGTDDSLLTGYVPNNAVTRSGIVRISGGASDAVNRHIFGSRNGASFFMIRNTNSSSKAQYQNGTGGSFQHSGAVTSGVLAVAGLDVYLDGTDIGNIAAGTYDQGAAALQIGSCPSVAGNYSGYIQALAVYDITLTPTQVSTIGSAMALLA